MNKTEDFIIDAHKGAAYEPIRLYTSDQVSATISARLLRAAGYIARIRKWDHTAEEYSELMF